MQDFIVVAIDGSAASGKTSTSSRISEKYNFLMVSTGSYYRAIASKLVEAAIGSDDVSGVRFFLQQVVLATKILGNISHIVINDELFEEKDLRTQSINEAVATYSAIPEIRQFLLPYQRSQVDIARKNGFNGVVMEGRDITTVVLSDADLRFFLEASVQERSSRRKSDRENDCVLERDKIDIERTVLGDGVYKINPGTNDLDGVVSIISKKIDAILAN
jgi:cytidylate kinase